MPTLPLSVLLLQLTSKRAEQLCTPAQQQLCTLWLTCAQAGTQVPLPVCLPVYTRCAARSPWVWMNIEGEASRVRCRREQSPAAYNALSAQMLQTESEYISCVVASKALPLSATCYSEMFMPTLSESWEDGKGTEASAINLTQSASHSNHAAHTSASHSNIESRISVTSCVLCDGHVWVGSSAAMGFIASR